MRFFITGLLLWFTITLPGSARSADEGAYPIVTLGVDTKAAARNNGANWKVCGDYFAAGESTEGKVVHFTFERGAPERVTRTFTFVTIDRISISVEEKVTAPVVAILWNGWNTRFVLKMNAKEYEAGLPCIAVKGTEV